MTTTQGRELHLGIFPMQLGRRSGGPQTYEAGLLPALADLAPEIHFTLYCLSEEAAAAAPQRPNVRTDVLRPRSRWVSVPLSLPWSAWRDGVELLHMTFTPPPFCPVPYVFTMHDVSMFEHPEFYPTAVRWRLVRLIERGLREARIVLCVSEDCRQAVLKRFDVDPARTRVAHHGVHARYRRIEAEARVAILERLGVEPPYLLHVGKYERRKNLPALLEAYAGLAPSTRRETRLVLAGSRVWGDATVPRAIQRLGLRDRVVELGYVADDDLPALYSGARAFVFPTLWEGFGLPILEAMACGTPVVASDGTCLPEIAGDAALLVDSGSVDRLGHALHRILEEPGLAAELSEKGIRRAREFTWEKSAVATLAAYRDALRK